VAPSAKSQEHLENNVALLSQEVERLAEMVKAKNKQLEELEANNQLSKANTQK
jgi:hypothetical protein